MLAPAPRMVLAGEVLEAVLVRQPLGAAEEAAAVLLYERIVDGGKPVTGEQGCRSIDADSCRVGCAGELRQRWTGRENRYLHCNGTRPTARVSITHSKPQEQRRLLSSLTST